MSHPKYRQKDTIPSPMTCPVLTSLTKSDGCDASAISDYVRYFDGCEN
jgi:hypothetical protein